MRVFYTFSIDQSNEGMGYKSEVKPCQRERSRKKSFFAAIVFVMAIGATAYAYDNGDFQVWHTENQEFRIAKNSKIILEEEFRWGDDGSDFYYHHYDAGFRYSPNNNLDLGLNYRQVYEKKSGEFLEQNIPYAYATFKAEFSGFKLEDRNRVEYKHFDTQDDSWRYRNKFTLKFPWKWTKSGIQPYLADEIFIEMDNGEFNRNRFYAGFGFDLLKHLRGEIYYLLQTSKSSGSWVNANVLGTKLKLVF